MAGKYTGSIVLLIFVCVSTGTEFKLSSQRSRIQSVWKDRADQPNVVHLEKSEVMQQVSAIRAKRQSGLDPAIDGDYLFNDINRYGQIYYSGVDTSSVIMVLTYSLTNLYTVATSNLYRSTNYGQTFDQIDSQLDSTDSIGPTLWYNSHFGSITKNLVVFSHANQPKIFYSTDEGSTWNSRTFSISTIDSRTLIWNTRHDQWALAHDITNNILYLTQNLGESWIKLSDNVELPLFDYQWGNPKYFDATSVFYNTYNPADRLRGNFTVGLYVQSYPYNNPMEVDPNLGRHDAFVMVGPYIFVQKTDNNVASLYTSYIKAPFKKAMIPAEDPHQTYYVSHIDELQALVIVEHESNQKNLYLSDATGVFFSLSLPDLVLENGIYDLELIQGLNGTLIANQYARADPSQLADTKRTLITLDNGGNWELVTSPDRYQNGTTVNCNPPECSLHLHMSTTEYARLGVFSLDSAPGLIIAHGTIGNQLSDDPDLYLSRDGGVTWEQTLVGSWGVNVADHGGLIVAARDYHQQSSTDIMYTCNEGQSWQDFTFSSQPMTVFGVITEPGEYTTTVSLYGIKTSVSPRVWDVVTVNFTASFERTCITTDFYIWQPWDDRTDTDCILGADVSIERRLPNTCCLIGTGYVRTVLVTTCACTEEDYDCDYGFKHSDGFVGPCIRDPDVALDDPCLTDGVVSYMKSTGYRKIPGDICEKGVEDTFKKQPFPCCESAPSTTKNPSTQFLTTTQKQESTTTEKPSTQFPTTTQKQESTTTEKPSTQFLTTTQKQESTTTEKPSTQFPTTHESRVTDEASDPLSQKYVVTVSALATLLGLAVLLTLVLGVLAGVFAKKHSKAKRQFLRLATSGDGMGSGGISYVRDTDRQVLLGSGANDQDTDSEDEEPLKL